MKKLILVFLSLVQGFYAAADVKALKETICKQLPSLDGWCSQEKAVHFIDLILQEKPKIWVEIGVFGGSSFFPVASTFKFLGEGCIIGIDPWDKVECIKYYDPVRDRLDLNWWGSLNLNRFYDGFLQVLRNHRLEPYSKIIRSTSAAAASQIDNIDVLYIDGNHDEFLSLQDVRLYLPKVRSGGFIWINDTLWQSRQEAIEFILQFCDFIELIDNGNCILFKKI